MLFMAIALSLHSVRSQSLCGNLDFEDGSLTNWKTYAGTVYDIDTLSIESYDPSRFEIISGGFDPMTGYSISMVAPGGNFSCRLGNSKADAEGEKMTYSINVTLENTLFIYKYAIVLEDPGHPILDQPQFEVKILNETGEITDQTCAYYQVSAASDIPGFQNFGSVIYKDWTTVGIDLSPFMGQVVTICFITKDCGYGGHFGYAYIDAESSKMEINTTACANSDSIHMQAPLGFEYLWQPGGFTGSSFSVPSEEAEESYSCTLTSVTGCEVTLNTTTEIVYINPDFTYLTCDTVRLLGQCSLGCSDIQSWKWDLGDGQYYYGKNPLHEYSGTGPYNVQLTVTARSGCVESITRPVEVLLSPIAKLEPVAMCAGMSGKIEENSLRVIPGITRYFWDFGDGTFSNDLLPEKIYDSPGSYLITLKVVNGPYCADITRKEIEIANCEVEIPNVITPNSDGLNEYFFIKNLEACSDKKLSVFNRWGNLVYSSEEYSNTWHADDLLSGVYYYVFEYSPMYPRNTEMAKTGHVTVLK